MSFGDTHSSANRGRILAGIAVIHGVAIYALVNGLGGVLVNIITPPPFVAHDYPPEVVVPVTPPPTHKGRTDIRPRTDSDPVEPTTVTIDSRLTFDGGTFPAFDPPTGGAGPITPPTPTFTPKAASPLGSPGSWASEADYPGVELRAGHEGVTRFALAIAPDGTVSNCTVTGSSGWPGLDMATCRLVASRARFRPATDDSGARVAGRFASAIRWVIPRD